MLDSRLARRMAYKKKLEEEYRLFQERCKYEKRKSSGYEIHFIESNPWSFEEISSGSRTRSSLDSEEYERKRREEEERKHAEEVEKQKLEDYLIEKEKWKLKKAEFSMRAKRFADLKKRRCEEKRKEEETKKILQSDDMWEELDNILRENENALKDLQEYHVCLEKIANEQKKRQEENRLKTSSARPQSDSEETDPELDSIYARIKELEISITTLDFSLERFEIDKMKAKTHQVKRRMSEAVGDGRNGTEGVNLQTIDMFLNNSNLWDRYLTSN